MIEPKNCLEFFEQEILLEKLKLLKLVYRELFSNEQNQFRYLFGVENPDNINPDKILPAYLWCCKIIIESQPEYELIEIIKNAKYSPNN